MSSSSSGALSLADRRRAEIEAKRAKLAALKKSREERTRNLSRSDRISSPPPQPPTIRDRKDIDELVNSLVGSRDVSTGTSRAESVLSSSGVSDSESASQAMAPPYPSSTKSFSSVMQVMLDIAPPPRVEKRESEVVTYSKEVQTVTWGPVVQEDVFEDIDEDEVLRKKVEEQVRKEIEILRLDEEKLAREAQLHQLEAEKQVPVISEEEQLRILTSDSFHDFLSRSSKIVERALDEDYDVLVDYTMDIEATHTSDETDKIKQVVSFYSEQWSKKRSVTSLDWSPKFPELLLASYTKNRSAPYDPDGVINIWNLHSHSSPEFTFHSTSDILTAKFSPFHPNLVVAGSYSGHILLYDTRARTPQPVLKTPLTGTGHTHPVYSISCVGTQGANMIISVSTDGVMCAWTTDMLARPQEYLELTHPPPLTTPNPTTTALLPSKGIDDLSPLSITFSRNDSSTFFVGTEDGGIYNINRYDRAGAKAGTDTTLRLTPHHAPVSKVELHRAGIGNDDSASEFDDLLLSTSLDWSIRLWRTRHTSQLTGDAKHLSPVIEWTREDMVYDCAWSPVRPSLFTTVDGSGALELWDLTSLDPEVPVAWTRGQGALNKVCWDTGAEGRRVVTGALDGRVQVWDLGGEYGSEGFGGKEEVLGIKKFLARCEGERGGAGSAAGVDREHRRSPLSWR